MKNKGHNLSRIFVFMKYNKFAVDILWMSIPKVLHFFF